MLKHAISDMAHLILCAELMVYPWVLHITPDENKSIMGIDIMRQCHRIVIAQAGTSTTRNGKFEVLDFYGQPMDGKITVAQTIRLQPVERYVVSGYSPRHELGERKLVTKAAGPLVRECYGLVERVFATAINHTVLIGSTSDTEEVHVVGRGTVLGYSIRPLQLEPSLKSANPHINPAQPGGPARVHRLAAIMAHTEPAILNYIKSLHDLNDQFARWIERLGETFYTMKLRKADEYISDDAISRLATETCCGKCCICAGVALLERSGDVEDSFTLQQHQHAARARGLQDPADSPPRKADEYLSDDAISRLATETCGGKCCICAGVALLERSGDVEDSFTLQQHQHAARARGLEDPADSPPRNAGRSRQVMVDGFVSSHVHEDHSVALPVAGPMDSDTPTPEGQAQSGEDAPSMYVEDELRTSEC